MLNGYLTLSAQSSLPHAGDKGIQMLWYEAKIEEGVLVAQARGVLAMGQLPVAAGLFTFLYFHLIIQHLNSFISSTR